MGSSNLEEQGGRTDRTPLGTCTCYDLDFRFVGSFLYSILAIGEHRGCLLHNTAIGVSLYIIPGHKAEEWGFKHITPIDMGDIFRLPMLGQTEMAHAAMRLEKSGIGQNREVTKFIASHGLQLLQIGIQERERLFEERQQRELKNKERLLKTGKLK